MTDKQSHTRNHTRTRTHTHTLSLFLSFFLSPFKASFYLVKSKRSVVLFVCLFACLFVCFFFRFFFFFFDNCGSLMQKQIGGKKIKERNMFCLFYLFGCYCHCRHRFGSSTFLCCLLHFCQQHAICSICFFGLFYCLSVIEVDVCSW